MKKGFLFFVVCALFINMRIAMADSLISPDKFREFAEWELDETDEILADIINRNNITEEKISSLSGHNKNLFINLVMDPSYINRYAYLFKADTIEPADHQIKSKNVLSIAIVYSFGIARETILIDLENGKYYYDPQEKCFDDMEEYENIGDLTPEQQESIRSLIETIPWNDFDYLYASSEDDRYIFDGMNCSLAIETTDGIIRFTIEDSADEWPETLIDFGRTIINELIWE